ncbi:DUF3139 domain-containing protein [Lagierella sp.]|uniref:DUF3139 domain-containing protein n=1 Tax=Lagierella sp. TaxID=2849657 RepID=UPI00260EAC19|nr:DUF3139 domain-containing protein [Lagierella sp.]
MKKKIIIIIAALILLHIASRYITGYIVEKRIDDFIAKQGIKKEEILEESFGFSLNLLYFGKVITLKNEPGVELRYDYSIYDPPIIVIPKKYDEYYNGVYYSTYDGKPPEEGQKYDEGTLGKDGNFLREFETINK